MKRVDEIVFNKFIKKLYVLDLGFQIIKIYTKSKNKVNKIYAIYLMASNGEEFFYINETTI